MDSRWITKTLRRAGQSVTREPLVGFDSNKNDWGPNLLFEERHLYGNTMKRSPDFSDLHMSPRILFRVPQLQRMKSTSQTYNDPQAAEKASGRFMLRLSSA